MRPVYSIFQGKVKKIGSTISSNSKKPLLQRLKPRQNSSRELVILNIYFLTPGLTGNDLEGMFQKHNNYFLILN